MKSSKFTSLRNIFINLNALQLMSACFPTNSTPLWTFIGTAVALKPLDGNLYQDLKRNPMGVSTGGEITLL
jgi:hypothetical protein